MDHWTLRSWTTRSPRTSVWTSWVQEQLLCRLLLLHIWVFTAATFVFHTTYTWLSHFQGNSWTWAENELWADKLPWWLLVPNHCPLWIALVLLWSEKLTCTHHVRDLPVKLGAGQRLPPQTSHPGQASFCQQAEQSMDGWQNKQPWFSLLPSLRQNWIDVHHPQLLSKSLSVEYASSAYSNQCSIVLSIKRTKSNLNYLCCQQLRLHVFLLILEEEYIFCACENSHHPCLLSRKGRLNSFSHSQEVIFLTIPVAHLWAAWFIDLYSSKNTQPKNGRSFPVEVTSVKPNKRTTSHILYLLMHPRRAFECLATVLYFVLAIAIHCHLLYPFLQQNKTYQGKLLQGLISSIIAFK